jgi:hypothetical protein
MQTNVIILKACAMADQRQVPVNHAVMGFKCSFLFRLAGLQQFSAQP